MSEFGYKKTQVSEMENPIICKLSLNQLRGFHKDLLVEAPKKALADIGEWQAAENHRLVGKVFHHTSDDLPGWFSGEIWINNAPTSWACWGRAEMRCKQVTRRWLNRITGQYHQRIKWRDNNGEKVQNRRSGEGEKSRNP